MARSAYFRAMLTPDAFREASGAAIALPAVSHAVFALVLHFLYTGAWLNLHVARNVAIISTTTLQPRCACACIGT